MVGYRLNELGTGAQRSGFQIWQELCHPDDRPELDEARAAIQSGASDTLSRTYRVRKNDGGWLWVQDRGRVVSWDETGIPLLVAGTRTDVHQQKMDQIALKESDQALREKVLQLTEANEHKTRFLATMSHELRTPLNAIIGYSDLLSLNLEENLSKRQLEYVGSISSSGTFLFELISDLLDLSALDAGGIQADVSKFSLVRLVPDVLSVFTQQVLSRDITVTVSGVEAIPDLYTDRRRLMQVLVNLVSNAVKYNRDGGSISIRAVHQGPRIVIDVEDTGAGIPEQEQDRVFDMFQRAAQNPKIAKPGTGIGLALARRIMESLGGTITLRSVVDEGTIFTLTLPIRWVDPRASTDDNMMHDPSIQPQLPLKIESDLR